MTAELCDLELWPHCLSTCANKDVRMVHYFVSSKNNDIYHFQHFPRVWMPPRLIPSFDHNMTAPNFKSSPTIQNTLVHDVTSSWPNSEQGAQVDCFPRVCRLPNPNHFLPGIRYIVFINAAKVDAGYARVGKDWSWHDDM